MKPVKSVTNPTPNRNESASSRIIKKEVAENAWSPTALWNDSNTHLQFLSPCGTKSYNFTATHYVCDVCEDKDVFKTVFACGPAGPYRGDKTWKHLCKTHYPELSCKKQHCNNCNKKVPIRATPSICVDCCHKLMDNFTEMQTICKFPDVSRETCGCKFCKH